MSVIYNRFFFFFFSSALAVNLPATGRLWSDVHAHWSHCFTVTVSVPEILDEIENVSAINKGNHNTMAKQWTSNRGQRVSSYLCINDTSDYFYMTWLKEGKSEEFND